MLVVFDFICDVFGFYYLWWIWIRCVISVGGCCDTL